MQTPNGGNDSSSTFFSNSIFCSKVTKYLSYKPDNNYYNHKMFTYNAYIKCLHKMLTQNKVSPGAEAFQGIEFFEQTDVSLHEAAQNLFKGQSNLGQ